MSYKKDRHLGRVSISREMVDDNLHHVVYAELTPLDVRHDPLTGNFEVIALSEHFDEYHGRYSIWDVPPYSIYFDQEGKVHFDRHYRNALDQELPEPCILSPAAVVAEHDQERGDPETGDVFGDALKKTIDIGRF